LSPAIASSRANNSADFSNKAGEHDL